MDDLEKLQQAKLMIDKLANGIDPVTNRPVEEGDCINQVIVSRCLFFVSNALGQLIEDGKARESQPDKNCPSAVILTTLKAFPFSYTSLTASEIIQRINDLLEPKYGMKIKRASLFTFLINNGLLYETQSASGYKLRLPTSKGSVLGVATEERPHPGGTHRATVYNLEAQRFILDNMETIIAINSEPPPPNQGAIWTSSMDKALGHHRTIAASVLCGLFTPQFCLKILLYTKYSGDFSPAL